MCDLPDRVIGLDQIRINRGLGKICKCKNRKFILDTDNRRVTCASCGALIEPYDALYDLAHQDEERNRQVEMLLKQKQEIADYKPWLVVIKKLEKQYRGYKLIPNCPRCGEPFYLEELSTWTGKQFADARIEKFKENNNE